MTGNRRMAIVFGVGGALIVASRTVLERQSGLDYFLQWVFLLFGLASAVLPFVVRSAPGEENTLVKYVWTFLLFTSLWLVMALALPWLAAAALLGGLALVLNGQYPLAQHAAASSQIVPHVDLLAEVRQLRSTSVQIAQSTTEMKVAVASQLRSVTDQSQAIGQIATALAEISTTSQETSDQAESVVSSAETSEQISQQGIESVSQNIEGLHRISEQVEAITANIFDLNEQTNQIGEIVATSSELAERSHVLALNASVEAARSGEAGKGFQVVAQEMKNLARQSKQATERIRRILGEIQRATQSVVTATEEGSRRVTAGIHLAQQAGEIIRQLSEVIGGSAESARLIATASKQLSTGIEQISSAMSDLTGLTDSIVTNGKHVNYSVQSLQILAQETSGAVDMMEAQLRPKPEQAWVSPTLPPEPQRG
jgi:ABC-type transporter Mla subunit MlaD